MQKMQKENINRHQVLLIFNKNKKKLITNDDLNSISSAALIITKQVMLLRFELIRNKSTNYLRLCLSEHSWEFSNNSNNSISF